MRVLIIEDDSSTRQTMAIMLMSEGFSVEDTDLGEEGVDLAKHYEFDAITLDLCLPDMSGFAVLRQIRAAGLKTPILICSAASDIETKVKTLGGGADDYLTKPFHKDELVARLRALVRRSQGHAESVITVGPLSVRMDQRIAEVAGVCIRLTGKEWQVLELLALRKGRTVTKDDFLNHLYGGMDEAEIKIIDVFICKLRNKLRAHGAGEVIATEWGRGYSLQANAAAPKPSHQHRVDEAIDTRSRVLAKLADGQVTTCAIARTLGIHEQTVRGHLAGLCRHGLALHLSGGTSRTGPAIYEVTAQGRAALCQTADAAAA